jgi:hypothetical protein
VLPNLIGGAFGSTNIKKYKDNNKKSLLKMGYFDMF